MAGCIVNENWFEQLPSEIIVCIFVILDTYELIVLRKVCSKFKSVIDIHLFKYTFNNPNTTNGYRNNINVYFDRFWMSSVKSINFLQRNEKPFNDDYNLHDNICSSQYEDANPKSLRIKIAWKNKRDGGYKYKKFHYFKYAINKLHALLFEKPFAYLLTNKISDHFFSEIIAKGLSKRGTDGYIGQSLDSHYVFPNIFAYTLAQIIFYLTDGVILLEQKMCHGNLKSYISTKITDNELPLSMKIDETYAVYILRYLIFTACSSIDYKFFYSSLSPNDKKKSFNV